MNSLLKKFFHQAKKLNTLSTKQSEREKNQLFKKLASLGLVKETSKLEDILNLTIRGILERRLQTMVYKKKLARSVKQARQFITHGHIFVGDKKMTIPSYLVKVGEESSINFSSTSSLSNAEHPERTILKEKAKEEKKKRLERPDERARRGRNKMYRGEKKAKKKREERPKEGTKTK